MNKPFILLILFLISFFITIPWPYFRVEKTENVATRLFQPRQKMMSQLDLTGQLSDQSFIGRWNSNNYGKAEFMNFQHSSGKTTFYFYQNESSSQLINLKMTIRDGDYLDKKVLVAADLPIISENDSNEWSNSLSISVTMFNEFAPEKQFNCDFSYSLKLQASDGSNDITGVDSSVLIFQITSSDCDVQISGELRKGEWNSQSQAIYYSLTVTLICVVKLVSVIKLIKMGNDNEADLNKISIITVSIATILDTYMCLFHLYMALYIESFFHFFITPAFWYFILFSIFEMRFLLMLWKARYFSTYETVRDVRKGLIFFYIKLYIALFGCLALLYFFILKSWLIELFYLFLIPQIVHCAIRRLNSGFLGVYILGFLGIRLIYPLYFRGCPENLFGLTPSDDFMISICSLMVLQIFIYFLQWKFGARFFIPAICLPPKFKYFREWKVNLSASEFDDCVICMVHLHEDPNDKTQPLLQETEENDIEMKKGVVTKKIMVTPCGHKYHIPCLKRWIEIKLECPTCRKNIPPVE